LLILNCAEASLPVPAGAPGGTRRAAQRAVTELHPLKGGVAAALQTNPGALKDGAFAKSQPGYTGASGGFSPPPNTRRRKRRKKNCREGVISAKVRLIEKSLNR